MKLLTLVALTFVVTVSGNPVDRPKIEGPLNPTGRIVGGESTSIEEVPHQVSLQLFGRHNCGASIISKYWVLTAAHCAKRAISSYLIRAGTDQLGGSKGSLHTVAQIIPHENYTSSSNGIPIHDIALLRVIEPFQFDATRQPVSLYNDNEESEPGALAIITGWGRTETGSPSTLQRAVVPMVSKDDCNEAYRKFGGLPVGQICAAYPGGGVDTCQGDSGGPLTIGGRQAGIVSWGNGCGIPGYPGAYTEVAYYRAWIRRFTEI